MMTVEEKLINMGYDIDELERENPYNGHSPEWLLEHLYGDNTVNTDAYSILNKAQEIMGQRAKDYDANSGERSMLRVIETFNAFKGRTVLSKSDGWLLMILLKLVRDGGRIYPHEDSLFDLVAYSALFAESRLKVNESRLEVKTKHD